jgi:hypothetical protein
MWGIGGFAELKSRRGGFAFLSVVAMTALCGCATHRSASAALDYGIRPCPDAADQHLLSADALQCWFDAPHGRWRTLSHESHFAVLVTEIEAADVRDAEHIARRFVEGERERFSEILVYVQRETPADVDLVRRIRWTREDGFEALDFRAPLP